MKRRKFISRSIQATALSTFTIQSALGNKPSIKPIISDSNNILPKKLKEGATIGLVAPGYALNKTALNNAIRNIKEMGFTPYHTSRIIGNHGYLSNTDEERINDIHDMFLNPEIDGIVCARGGYGTTRIIDNINFEVIKNNPKILVGFSDITVLLNSIYQKTGLITFHGPVGTTLNNAYNRDHLKQLITDSTCVHISSEKYSNQTVKNDPTFEQYIINDGVATGKLIGGNLSLLTAMTGTNTDIDYTDKLVFIEEIDEEPYRIDRMLTQLLSSNTFRKAKGIILGVFKGCNSPKRSGSFILKEVILDRLKPLNIPTVYGFSFGHINHNNTFPVGVLAKLDTASMQVELLEKSIM